MRLRPRAELFIFKDMKVLADLTNGSYVVFPGGGIEFGETPIEGAKRECHEEAGRRVINLTPAHPPSVQIWPEGFAKGKSWAKGHVGGYTHWFTGSSSEDIDAKAAKHPDHQPGFAWHCAEKVLEHLKHDIGSMWADDAKVRMAILDAHVRAHKKHEGPPKEKKAGVVTVLSLFPDEYPTLNLVR